MVVFYIKLNRQITLWCATLILTDLYMMWIKQPIKKVRKESEYEKEYEKQKTNYCRNLFGLYMLLNVGDADKRRG